MDKKGIATSLVLAIIFGLSTIGMGTYIVYDNVKTGGEVTSTTDLGSNNNEEQSTESVESSSNGLKDSNQELTDTIRKLALEQMPYADVNADMKMVSAKINKIEIFDEAYVAAENDRGDIGISSELFEQVSNESIEGKTIEALGNIAFTVDFDKEVTSENVRVAGSGGNSHKNSLTTIRHFYLYKTADGKYELNLVTGW